MLRQPCFCLCFGFSQITRNIPLRLMILHFSQIFLIDDRTFMIFPRMKSDYSFGFISEFQTCRTGLTPFGFTHKPVVVLI